MRPGQRAVLLELAELERLVDDQWLNGWWRPYHVRYFRPDNPIRRRGTQLESVKSDLRALAAAGLVERREGKAALYRISDEGRRTLEGEVPVRSIEEIKQAIKAIEESNGFYEELAGAAAALRWVLGGQPNWEES